MEFWDGSDFNPAPPPVRKKRLSSGRLIAIVAAAALAIAAIAVGLLWQAPVAAPSAPQSSTAAPSEAMGDLRVEQQLNADGTILVTFRSRLTDLQPQMIYAAGFYYGLENANMESAGNSSLISGVKEADILSTVSLPASQAGQSYQCMFFHYPLSGNQFTIGATQRFVLLSPGELAAASVTPVPTAAPTPVPTQAPKPTAAPTATPHVKRGATPTARQFHAYPAHTRYFFHQLTEHEQELFAILYDGICRVEASISVPTESRFTGAEFSRVLDVLTTDCPELMMLEDGGSVPYRTIDGYVSSVDFGYTMTRAEADRCFDRTMDAVRSMANQSGFGQTDYDHELAIYRYLLANCQYDQVGERCAFADGPWVEGYGKCSAYAHAFVLGCRYYGIQAFNVSGDTIDNGQISPEGHMWSYVNIGGEWYICDATWDDPTGERNGPPIYYECLKYFNITDAEAYQVRMIDPEITALFTLPSCTATDYQFYNQTMPHVTVTGPWQDFLRNGLTQCLQNGGDTLVMRFLSRADFEMAMLYLEDEVQSWAQDHVRSYSWRSLSNPETLMLVLFDMKLTP